MVRSLASYLGTPHYCLVRIFILECIANTAVTHFYFMQLYYFRLIVSDLAQPTPPHTMYSYCYDKPDEYCLPRLGPAPKVRSHAMFRLPLFMVGIETKDCMHLDWIATRFRTALSQVRSIQEQSKMRVSIVKIRQILQSQSD